jgi:hypothetical protein
MKKLFIFLAVIVTAFILYSSNAYASHMSNLEPTYSPQMAVNEILSRFRFFHEFSKIEGSIPRVAEVELPKGGNYTSAYFTLIEDDTTTLQPFEIISKQEKLKYEVFHKNKNSQSLSADYLSDNNMNTFYDFPLSGVGSKEQVVIRFVFPQPITTQTLQLFFSPDGDIPTSVTMKSFANNTENIIFADRDFSNGVIYFPERTASEWEVILNHSQPLRLLEANFIEKQTHTNNAQYIRFLMRPGSPYILFSNPDGFVDKPYLEQGNLASVTDVLTLPFPLEKLNPLYTPSDLDRDGISDSSDNCPSLANKDQKDTNNNGAGDACEDFDKDGILNGLDNCPSHPNRTQQDADGDKVGDHCDDEESRLTERLAFLPWVGILLGFGVVIGLFAVTMRKSPHIPQKENK